MDDLFFTEEENTFIETIVEKGLLSNLSQSPKWTVLRIALARSLRLETEPDESFARPKRDRRSELHLQQITGRGMEKDFDDAVRLMLTLKHQRDLFADQTQYVDVLQRHLRRGLHEMMRDWRESVDFHDYLLDEFFHSAGSSGDSAEGAIGTPTPEMMLKALTAIGVAAQPTGEPVDGPRLTRFPFTLESHDALDRLRKGLDDLSFSLGIGATKVGLVRESGERKVTLEVARPRGKWQDVRWSDVEDKLTSRPEALPVCPGTDITGAPFIFDLAETPHLFVAGATGSGKSVCLNAILLSLLVAERTPDLVLIDPKGLDFTDYEGSHALREGRVVTDMEDGVTVLRDLVTEMDRRSGILRDHGARNIAEAQAAGATLERVVVVIDELADFLLSKSGAEEPLVRLAQKARASGIHLVLATQRPEAATFPGLLRANIPSRIALTVQKASDSRIILDEGGAEDLLMRGDMLVRLAGRDTKRVHGVRVERADISRTITSTGLAR